MYECRIHSLISRLGRTCRSTSLATHAGFDASQEAPTFHCHVAKQVQGVPRSRDMLRRLSEVHPVQPEISLSALYLNSGRTSHIAK